MTGKAIVVASWSTLAVFAVVAIPDAPACTRSNTPATLRERRAVPRLAADLDLRVRPRARALGRGDDIGGRLWVFLAPSAPKEQRRHLLGATGVCVVVALATACANPFSALVPMLPLGCAALWGARHGVFPARRTPAVVRGARR